jgi:hypothetical protein
MIWSIVMKPLRFFTNKLDQYKFIYLLFTDQRFRKIAVATLPKQKLWFWYRCRVSEIAGTILVTLCLYGITTMVKLAASMLATGIGSLRLRSW